MCFAPQRRAIFGELNFQKWFEHGVFYAFWLTNVLGATAACNFSTSELQKVVQDRQFLSVLTWKCALRHSGVQFFMSLLKTWLRPRHFSEPTFRPSRPTNHRKTQHFATFLTFRESVSSFFWLSRSCIFFLLTLLLFSAVHLLTLLVCSSFQLSILSEVSLLNFLWWYIHISCSMQYRTW